MADLEPDAATIALVEQLRETSDSALLQTMNSLTHRIHAASAGADDDETLDDLRLQRRLVEGEALRRMRARL